MVEYPNSILLKKGNTPAMMPIFVVSNTYVEVVFEYICDYDTKIYSNIHLDTADGGYFGDFPHAIINLSKSQEYKQSKIIVHTLEFYGKYRGNIRIWSEDKIPVRIKNCYIKVVKPGVIIPPPIKEAYKRLHEEDKKKKEIKDINHKKIILMIDKKRLRSPLLTAWQNELTKNDKYIFIRDDRVNLHLKQIVKHNLNGQMPDLIYAGFDTGLFFIHSREYIIKNNIPVISETGDNDLFGKQRICVKRVRDIPIRLLICHSLYNIDNVYNKRKEFWFLKNSNVIYIPWSIDYKKYQKKTWRDIDVTCISTTITDWPFHKNKIKVKEIVASLGSINNKPIKKFLKNVYGDEYIRVLNRTKIAVVAGRGRLTLPQKYLESAAAGCMLIGEVSPELDGILEDGKSIIAVKMGNYDNLQSLIHYYLKHPKEREEIAKRGREAIIKHLSVENTADKLVNKLEKMGLI